MSDVEHRIADFLREEAVTATLSPGTYERVLRGARVRRMVTLGAAGLGIVAFASAGFVAAGTFRGPANVPAAAPAHPVGASPTSRDVAGCPVTVQPAPGFVPPEPYPADPPTFHDSVWYGSADLWTVLAAEGEVWRDLPEDDGRFTQKLLWWSEGYPPEDGGAHQISLSGRRLDAPGSFAADSGGGGSRADTGSFMIVGFAIPAGCWELTATYRGAELSYVALLEG